MKVKRWSHNGKGFYSAQQSEKVEESIDNVPVGYVLSADKNPRHFVEVLQDGWENHIEVIE